MLYAVGGEKGGTGKTQFATGLAVCLATVGRDVVLVDADGQRSSAKWAMKRAALPRAGGFARVPWVEMREDIFEALMDLKGRYEDVVVDVGGTDSQELRHALAAGDELVSPILPSDVDLETIEDLADLVAEVRSMGNRRLRARVVINKRSPQHYEEEVADVVETLGRYPALELARTQVVYRRPMRRAFKARLGITEYAAHPEKRQREAAEAAIEDVWTLFEEITGHARK